MTGKNWQDNFKNVGRLWAGAAKKEINPPSSIKLAGYFGRASETAGLHDPLELNLIWLEDGSTPLIFLTLDLLLFDDPFGQQLKNLLAEEMAIPEASILVAVTHTHSAPAIHDFHGLNFRDHEWEETILAKALGAAKSARNQARRASWAYKAGEIRIVKNRREENGPVDPLFPNLLIIDPRENPVALITGYGCHPVCLDERNLLISADYVGAFRGQIRKYLGLDLPLLFFIGAAGDVNPQERGSFEAARKLGQELLAVTANLLKEMSFSGEIKLNYLEKKVEFALINPFSPEEIQRMIADWEQKLERAKRKPDWLNPAEKTKTQALLFWARELQAALLNSQVPATLSAILAGYRLNDIIIISHPFEIFVSLGQKAREKVKSCLWFASCSHGYGGYLADEEEMKKGGYEFEEAYRYFSLLPLAPQSDQIFLQTASQIVENS